MLAMIEIPKNLEKMYARYKQLSQAIYKPIKKVGEIQKIPKETNLFGLTSEMSFIYIIDGFFKLFIKGKPVRLYSESDFIVSGNQSGPETQLKGDFGGEVAVFNKEIFSKLMLKYPKLLDAYVNLTDLDNSINRYLGALFMRPDVTPDFELKEYEEGETIIQEGDQSTNIFEMLSGEAKAVQGNTEVGIINEGEIFGEVSFFTGAPRNATVIATENCMVRIINQNNFSDMIKSNPNFGIAISRTLAKRFSDVNRKLAEQG